MKVRKIAALAVGAAMIGATIGFASAQPTVPNIPKDFFVKDGQPNVKIVVGSQGAAMDVASAADIAVAIGTLLYTEKDVEVKSASIVVKKDVTSPVVGTNPADIPIFFNEWYTYGNASKPYAWTPKEKMGNVAGWWNGGEASGYSDEVEDWFLYYPNAIVSTGNFVKYDESAVLSDDIINVTETQGIWRGGNPLDFTLYDYGYVKFASPVQDKAHNLELSEGNIIDYHIYIKEIKLNGLEDLANVTNPEDISGKLTLSIPANDVEVSMTYAISTYSYMADKMCGCTGYYLDDGINPGNVDRLGVTKGDTIDLFGRDFTIVGVNETLQDFGTYQLVIGTPYQPTYINAGQSETFGNYSVKVLDIDVNSNKALLEVTDLATGDSKIITLYTEEYAQANNLPDSDYAVLFNGGIYVKLKSVFIGIGGTTSAQVEVATDLKGLNEGDEILPGWIIKKDGGITIATDDEGNKYLQKLVVTNDKELSGSSITLFNTYKLSIDSSYREFSKNCLNDVEGATCDFYVAKVWINFDPLTKTVTETKTLTVGEKLDDWTIENINATTEPAKADVVSKVVKPITVLDTEIMKEGLDKVDSNLILIGGPVVNSVTAALADKLGIPANYTGWKEEYGTGAESGVIKYIAKCGMINDHGVVLVAGTDREGTRAAAEALMEYIASLH